MSYLITLVLGLLTGFGGTTAYISSIESHPTEPSFAALSIITSAQLATDPDNGECLTTNGSVNEWASCAAGGSGDPFPFTPQSWGNSTSTTIGFAQGIISSASTTLIGTVNLASLISCDTIDTDANGVLSCGTDATGAGGGDFPFTPKSWGNSTSTTLGFLAGFLATGSSTITGNATTTGMHGFGSIFLSNDRITDLAGTNLTVTGNVLNVDNPVVADLTGNASTATALAANGSDCSAGSYALGVDASGAAEGCTDATTEIDSAITTHASNANAHHNAATLAGEDYLSLSTQQITANAIDPDNLSASDFGAFTCNGTNCSLDEIYSTSGYPFPLAGNATSTLTQFNGGLTAYGSTTVGGGTSVGGLTVIGNATTTNHLQVMNSLAVSGDVGDSIPPAKFAIIQSNTTNSSGILILDPTRNFSTRWYIGSGGTQRLDNGFFATGIISINGTQGSAGTGIGRVTVGSTTPWAQLSVQKNYGSTATGLFAVASSTATNGGSASTIFSVDTALSYITSNFGLGSTSPQFRLSVGSVGSLYGSIVNTENPIATTTTSQVINWANGNQQLIRGGTSAVIIGFNNASTSGQTMRLVYCNPGASAGAITWNVPSLRWAGGTAPTQTTTANKCDVWSFIVTQATSTGTSNPVIFGAATSNF